MESPIGIKRNDHTRNIGEILRRSAKGKRREQHRETNNSGGRDHLTHLNKSSGSDKNCSENHVRQNKYTSAPSDRIFVFRWQGHGDRSGAEVEKGGQDRKSVV